jgi:hypothetical protein
MRLWSIHPQYLDRQGLVALWREALLARAVLGGATRGYRHHPQLERFRVHPSPRFAINSYLSMVCAEAAARGYRFDRSKTGPVREVSPIPIATGQLSFEWQHLLGKLAVRNPLLYARWRSIANPECHPLFHAHEGPVASWERTEGGMRATPDSP